MAFIFPFSCHLLSIYLRVKQGKFLLPLAASGQMWAVMGLYRYETAKLRGVIGAIIDLKAGGMRKSRFLRYLGGVMVLRNTGSSRGLCMAI